MSIYAIGDLHLSFGENKPMDIFGDQWKDHTNKIKKNWEEMVKPEDTILLPGDFSWAMHLEDTKADFTYLNSLPGKKILLKGNHDYWWTTLASMRRFLEENAFQNIDFLYNNSYLVEDSIIAGTRGWALSDIENDSKMIKREVARLELSLQDAVRKYGTNHKILVCMHYPPVTKPIKQAEEKSIFLDVMKKYSVNQCIYGHLHGNSHQDAVEGIIEGIDLKLVSADYLDFHVKEIECI